MADPRNPNLRAVPNPPQEPSETRELVKTVAITAVVSSLVGVFAVAGGTAVYNMLKRAVSRKEEPKAEAPPSPPQPQSPYREPPRYRDEPPDYEAGMPDALRYEPKTRGRRRAGGADRIRQMEDRMRTLEKRFSEYEEEDDEEEEDEE